MGVNGAVALIRYQVILCNIQAFSRIGRTGPSCNGDLAISLVPSTHQVTTLTSSHGSIRARSFVGNHPHIILSNVIGKMKWAQMYPLVER